MHGVPLEHDNDGDNVQTLPLGSFRMRGLTFNLDSDGGNIRCFRQRHRRKFPSKLNPSFSPRMDSKYFLEHGNQ
jgi:hypothetical protein